MGKILKDNDGFTMMEFVVALAIMGVLMSIAIPSYNNVAEKTQAARNLANMEVIREVFFQYYYRTHQQRGQYAHFPPPPLNDSGLMDEEWASAPMDSTRSYKAPKNLFSDGEFPMNSNNFPFRYETWSDTLFSSGEVSQYIKIEDVDEDSPTFGKSFIHSI